MGVWSAGASMQMVRAPLRLALSRAVPACTTPAESPRQEGLNVGVPRFRRTISAQVSDTPSGSFERQRLVSERWALKTNGGVECWGDNSYRQSGTNRNLQPTECRRRSYLRTRSNGTVVCWGEDSESQASIPNQIFGQALEFIGLGAFHSCVVTSGGAIECWGSDTYGQCSP